MKKLSFKIYNKLDYCEESLTYLLIKSAIILAWEEVYNKYNLSQKYKVRHEIIKPNVRLETILNYSCGKNNYAKNSFNCFLKNALHVAFDKKANNWFNINETVENKKLTLFKMYDVFKEYSVNKNLNINDEKMFHEENKKKYM